MGSFPVNQPYKNWRSRLYEIIFGTVTPAGKAFDVVLIWSILFSVVIVILESVHSIRSVYGDILYGIEWFFTILFTIEYILRLISVKRPLGYATSFFGLVDLLAILPTYLSIFIPGSQSLLTIRTLRLLRIFRVFKLTHYTREARVIMSALRASGRKISVFISAVLTIVVIIGSVMYVIEGEKNGFVDIPTSIYWAIVTLTTVGYGDLSPHTPLGKALASCLMIMGYGIIAVPTGIVTVELSQTTKKESDMRKCPGCSIKGHAADAEFCRSCGKKLL
ncbi:MAG: ion transporter [Desulfobacteraceae bacterium]|nr:ion transporter [Desulfobacteraceae bacterium]MBC2755364.1 ion transporter [Desulfobacteraceae bacterium]